MSVLSSPAANARVRLRARRGFTIVELLVAIIIISVGLLALASGSAATLREMELAQQQSNASMIAQSRLERLRATACASIASGSTSVAPAYTDKWAVSSFNGSSTFHIVAETVSYKDRRGSTKKFGVGSVMPCQ